MSARWLTAILLAGSAALGGVGLALAGFQQDAFDHVEHRGLFPSCVSCHAGIEIPGAALYPDPPSCAECHDGEVEERVEWDGPVDPPRTNLAFDHAEHADTLSGAGREPARCVDCHSFPDSAWMYVQLAVVEQCLDCHEIRETHYAAAETDCAMCHVSLARAVRLTESDIADFPAPSSHEEPDFAGRSGHGLIGYEPVLAPATPEGAAVACAVCHARDFCMQCHVDAPEQVAIQALSPDPRSLVHAATLEAPDSHTDSRFLTSHGPSATSEPAECRTCHTQESCLECHLAAPRVVSAMYQRSPQRGVGAIVEREPPLNHGNFFLEQHAVEAAAAPQTCAGCHVRSDCLDCHIPGVGAGSPGYHGNGFLTRHPAAAYARESSCSDCHNPAQYCAACHASAGLVAERRLSVGYHDAKQAFILGHGPAARQNLESCVSCHTERDCVTCHSALGGRRFNPHGQDFDADRLRRRNPEMCTACHGAVIPGSE